MNLCPGQSFSAVFGGLTVFCVCCQTRSMSRSWRLQVLSIHCPQMVWSILLKLFNIINNSPNHPPCLYLWILLSISHKILMMCICLTRANQMGVEHLVKLLLLFCVLILGVSLIIQVILYKSTWSLCCFQPQDLSTNTRQPSGYSAVLSLISGPNLKVISTLSVGFDHLALDEIKKR